MSWRYDPSTPYDPHGGRNAFRNDDSVDEAGEHPLSRTARAMRSFTESIECDVPPVPELPASLDIDVQMKNSDTNDTIIEVVTKKNDVDNTLGETQKYKMAVPGPGQTEQETELHKSLLKDNDADSIDIELEALGNLLPKQESEQQPDTHTSRSQSLGKRPQDLEHQALRQQYSTSALTRPRPTTPTQACAIESSAFLERTNSERERERERQQKIQVKIPTGGKKKRSEMTHSEYYEYMSNQMPAQARRTSSSGRTTPLNDYEGDILEEHPEYRDKAPPKPVVHRRTSVEWENFAEKEAKEMEEREKSSESQRKTEDDSAAFAGVSTAGEKSDGDVGFEDSFSVQKQQTVDEPEPEPSFSEDMAEERERYRKLSGKMQPATGDVQTTRETPKVLEPSEHVSEPEEQPPTAEIAEVNQEISVAQTKEDTVAVAVSEEESPKEASTTEPTQRIVVKEPSTDAATEENAGQVHFDVSSDQDPSQTSEQYQYYDENGQPYDYSQYPGYNPETGQYEGTYTDEYGNTHSYADYYAHYYDANGQPIAHDEQATTAYDQTAYDQTVYDQTYDQAAYDQTQQQETGETYVGTEHEQSYYGVQHYPGQPVDPSGLYDEAYYNSEEYSKWYEANYGQVQEGAEGNDASQYYQEGYDQSGQTAEGYQNQEGYQQATYSQEAYSQQDSYPQDAYYQQGYDATQYQGYDAQTGYSDQQTEGYQQYDYSQGTQNGYADTQPEAAYQQPQSTAEEPAVEAEAQQQKPPEEPQNENLADQQQHQNEQQQPPARPPPVLTQPLFVQAPPAADPFGWDSHDQKHEETAPSSTAQPIASPSRPPPPSAAAAAPQKEAEAEAEPEPVHEQAQAPARPAPPPTRPPPAAQRPPPPRPGPPPVPAAPAAKPAPKPVKEEEPEEDAWTKFKKMTEKVEDAVKSTESTMKSLNESTVANEIKDESYLAQIGGEQGFTSNLAHKEIQKQMEEKKNAKIIKKKVKQQGKRAASPQYDVADEDKMDRAAEELARQLAAKLAMSEAVAATGVKEHKPTVNDAPRKDSQPLDAIPPRKKSSIAEAHQESSSLDLPSHAPLSFQQSADSAQPIGDFHPDDPALSQASWADFDRTAPELPPSESGFFSKEGTAVPTSSSASDPFAPPVKVDPFAVEQPNLMEDNYDPFEVRPVEDIVAAAKAKAEAAKLAVQANEDLDFFGATERRSNLSTPTPEGGSPLSARPTGFEDDFKCEGVSAMSTPTPLYDEDDSQPLEPFISKFDGDGWELMIRHPLKKKIMADRFWKPCFVRLNGNTLLVYNAKTDAKPIQELLLQATYSLSDTTLQAYDVYGKIHTVKLQFVQYKEKVGIRPGQISRLVEGHITKYGLPLEHTAQCNVLLKFGSLDATILQSFVTTIEDVLFRCPAKRDTKPVYKQDEVQIHCYDEYSAYVDKDGLLSQQKARVRLFCLAFVSGSPILEIGLNDRRRQGKEIVRRKDILPMYTERWIRFEDLEFHSTVNREAFDNEQVIALSPPDGCFFEIMRFRIRPPQNREKALSIKGIMKIAGSKVEIRIEAMAAAQVEKSRGGKATRRQVPSEDIVIRFPIPEAWIYIFREERHWGVGSVHSKKMRPGKVKNLKDRLLGAVQTSENNLIEVAIGEAKYEHVYRSLVWRIPRLPEKHHAAYKAHLLKCRFELSSFDLMPETFLPLLEVDFTMPLATVSNTVVRSVSVEQHEDSDRVEKFVRYVAKCQYKVEVDYIQCSDLDVDAILDPSVNPDEVLNTVPELHKPAIQPGDVAQMHEGYRIDLPEQQFSARKDDSSSDEEEEKKFPTIQIDMTNYGY